MDKLFEIHNMSCSYDKSKRGDDHKMVLEIKDLVLPRGKKIFIVGESGIGKSTILEVLGMMNNTIVPNPETQFVFYDTNGRIINLIDLWHRNNDRELSEFRRMHFNFIFQNTNLMRNFTAYENVAITRMLQGYSRYSTFKRTAAVLEDLGLRHIHEERKAQELSGGQQQRLSFARAILPDFTVLFGDEPTGNLDSDNAIKVMQILSDKLTQLEGSSAIIVSHDMHIAATFADIVIKIRKQSRINESLGETTFYGVVDQSCIYVRDSEMADTWTNGEDIYPTPAFELFLKRI